MNKDKVQFTDETGAFDMKYSVMLIVYFLMFLIEALASPRLKGWPEKFEASDNCDGEAEMKGLEAWRCASASAEGGQFLTMGVSAVCSCCCRLCQVPVGRL